MKVHNNKRRRRVEEEDKGSQGVGLRRYEEAVSLADKYGRIC